MKLKHKGFTLIELLAVIIVLSIIALITTPIVMNSINKSKKGAAEISAEGYIRAVETIVVKRRSSKDIIKSGEYEITSDGNLCKDKSSSCSDEDKIIIETKGKKPTFGTVIIDGYNVKQGTTMVIGDYGVVYEDGTYVATQAETYRIIYNLTNVTGNNATSVINLGTKTLRFTADVGYKLPDNVTVSGASYTWDKKAKTLILSNVSGDVTVTISGEKKKPSGEIVYFNVTTGKVCSESNYTSSQSKSGVKSGCMKFYTFNDNEDDKTTLILDHNTTDKVVWNSFYKNSAGNSFTNAQGPKQLLDKLKEDTKDWQGTETPENYTMDQTGQGSNANYTIDYSTYKARLISAQEIATIVENTTWNERTDKTSLLLPKWLYENIGDGYWTSSSYPVNIYYAWRVSGTGGIHSINVNSSNGGVRPVITVLKSKLS